MKTPSHLTSRLNKGKNQNTSRTACVVESLETRLCMTASITIDPGQSSFAVSEHETIGFANKVGGPTLATLHWQDIPQDPSQFQVSLAWSDGTVTKGGVRSFQNDPDGNPEWEIEQAEPKTFGDPGKLTCNISINQVGHPEVNASTVAFADVQEYPIRPHGKNVSANASPRDLKNVTIATFEDGYVLNTNVDDTLTDSKGSASNFAATIDWGDGTTSAGAIISVLQTKGLYNVVGSHYYNGLTAHTYGVKVHIVETATGNNATANSFATVYNVPVFQPINIVTAPLNPFSSTPVSKVWN
jgi:hypothetical protein